MPGLKVRMELAWQKEREDQQRLLQETATLARDLRQTLFEVCNRLDDSTLLRSDTVSTDIMHIYICSFAFFMPTFSLAYQCDTLLLKPFQMNLIKR
jgi:polysaccharide pyruvyl transferase WcaK-like protein